MAAAAHSPGFPSGHTSAAVAFYPMAAYFVAGAVSSRWAKRGLYAVDVIGLAAFSRLALRAHWPLDVLGGLVAAAIWLNERHPDRWTRLRRGLACAP